jgi:hypothetical protein
MRPSLRPAARPAAQRRASLHPVLRPAVLATAASAALVLAPLATGPATAAGAANASQVSVLHGVPGLTVDVYANGDRILSGFEPGSLTDPLTLPAGDYDLAVFPAGQPSSGTPAIRADDVAVPGGANVTVVAHLDASGKPALTPFVNDTSKVPAGKARVTVRHVAAAPAVDVRAGGTPVFTDLANPEESSAEVDAGTVPADVVLAGTSTVAVGPADLDLGEGTSTVVHAWGSAADGNLALATQTIDGLHSAPGGVPSGTGGQADDSLPPALFGVALLGALLATAGTAIGVRRRAGTRA